MQTVSVSGRVTNGMGPAESARLRFNPIGVIFPSYDLIPVLTAYGNVVKSVKYNWR